MRISEAERQAIKDVINAGASFGYGNMISHLQSAWAMTLIDRHGFTETQARESSGGNGYPFRMQEDLIVRGEWDETGERYKE